MPRPNSSESLPFVSVVIPVKNGAGRLEHCLESLRDQDYPTDRYEVIVADGRSSDSTVEIASSFGARVVDNEREIVSSGRNAGIASAKGAFIAFTDDDCVLPAGWLRNGVQALRRTSAAAVGGPTPIPRSSRPFSRAVNQIFQWASLAGKSVQSDALETQLASDLPGGNAMYRREVLEEVGPINEHLITAEDVDLHLRMVQRGHLLLFAPAFEAEHCKRDSPRGFFRQMRRFAIGRVQLWRLNRAGMGKVHWFVAVLTPMALLASAGLIAVGAWPVLTVTSALSYAALTLAAVLTGESMKTGLWVAPVLAIFAIAWSFGVASELLFPIQDPTGK